MGDKQLNHISLWLMDFVKGRGFDENHDSNKDYRILNYKWHNQIDIHGCYRCESIWKFVSSIWNQLLCMIKHGLYNQYGSA